MTALELIVALGGVPALASYLDVTRTAVYNWSNWGSIPPRHYFRLKALADAADIAMPEELFREVSRNEKVMLRSEHGTQAQGRGRLHQRRARRRYQYPAGAQ